VGAGVLTSDERAEVQRQLAAVLADADVPRNRIRDIVPESDEHRLILLSDGTNDPLPLARITLNACLQSRWSRNPPMLATLLKYLVDWGVGSLALLRDEVANQRVDPSLRVYQDTWLLDNSRPFFDRHDLRNKTRELIDGSGRPILRLPKADDSFGRSYTLDFLAHLEESRGGSVSVIAVEIADGGGPSYTVEDLLRQVAAAVGGAEPIPERTRSSYAESAVLWLLELMKPGPRWVLVLDGFGQPGVADELHETVRLLAHRVTMVPYRKRMRLVLLDYPPGFPGPLPVADLAAKLPGVKLADLLTETLPTASGICRGDLLPCLQAWNGLRVSLELDGLEADELAKVADGLLAKAPASGKERLEELHYQLLLLLDLPDGGLDAVI
jgi:hypothetical protein